MRIGIIGTGTIATAVVEGLAGLGHQITVSERSAEKAERLAATFTEVTVASNAGVIAQSDVVFVGLMAEVAADVLGPLTLRDDQTVISLMGGLSLSEVALLVAPATADAVIIPFPAIATGGSAILVRGETALIRALFAPRNTLCAVSSDEELSAYLCAQAVLSPVVKLVADAASWVSADAQSAGQAEAFLRHLVGSSLLGSACAPLLKALDTPGGYNQRLLHHMGAGGMSKNLVAGLNTLKDDR
ncbi:MAG: NAD(P)-binding domain-containing protein [Sulfitobacter sp.]